VRIPPLTVVSAVITALHAHDAVAAVGGSGLLASLGLTDEVRDWDVTTDAPAEVVDVALRSTGLDYGRAVSGDARYATRARFAVTTADHQVEVLVGFAIHDGTQVVALPTRVSGTWRGLPMADPSVWLAAYRLLGRQKQAAWLETWLNQQAG
jgi:hypothetical protein